MHGKIRIDNRGKIHIAYTYVRKIQLVSWCVGESKASDCVTNQLLPGLQISCYPVYKWFVTQL